MATLHRRASCEAPPQLRLAPQDDACKNVQPFHDPVTSFAGKTVAVFGLGGSGLASCHALRAGGAEVIASDDSAEKLAEAAQAGFVTADLQGRGRISQPWC